MRERTGDQPVVIRRFEHDDLDGVLSVEGESFDADAMPAPVFVQFAELASETFLVAADDDGVSGYVVVAPRADEPSTGLIVSIGVHPRSRRMGIARALMERVAQSAAGAGIRRLELTVAPGNQPARSLYRDLGFEQVGALVRDYYGPGEDRYVLVKHIEGGCHASDENLQAEASTSVAWSNLLTAVAGAALAGLIASGSVDPVAYWYVLLALLGSLYSSQYYANVSGVVGRLRRNQDPERLLIIGNSLSEYLAFYPLVLATPLVVLLLTGSVAVAVVAIVADLLMFGFYQLGDLNVECRQAGKAASILTFILIGLATVIQVAAVSLDAPGALYATGVLATVGLVALTVRGVISAEA